MEKKIDWLAKNGGMALVNVHPDYINFSNTKLNQFESFPVKNYTDFLEYIKTEYKDQYWHVLPKQLAKFWKDNIQR